MITGHLMSLKKNRIMQSPGIYIRQPHGNVQLFKSPDSKLLHRGSLGSPNSDLDR